MTNTDIIYIEDDDIVARIFTIGFKKYHLNTLHIADTRSETLEALNTPRYQQARAIFFDLNICGVDGLNLACQFRDAGDNRLFFLVTASENPNPNLLKKYQIHYLRKPFDFREVAETILLLVAE
ncbi:MAG: hypothetical protein K8I60_22970 [Anaerolineae bacterium]|nr:hypothetical protein [Anaerolineae bacterium]